MVQDTTALYNIVLSSSQVTERYNNGDGTETIPTGVTEATELIANFDFNEGSGTTVDNDCTLGAGQDITLYNTPTWVNGLIGATAGQNGSIGVASAGSFSATENQSRFFGFEMPHAWDEATDVEPHLHIAYDKSITSGKIRFGMEFTFSNMLDDFPNTTIIYAELDTTYSVSGGLMNDYLSFGLISTTDKEISSISPVRIFRDAEHTNDTFTGVVHLNKVSIHVKKNSNGSRLISSK